MPDQRLKKTREAYGPPITPSPGRSAWDFRTRCERDREPQLRLIATPDRHDDMTTNVIEGEQH